MSNTRGIPMMPTSPTQLPPPSYDAAIGVTPSLTIITRVANDNQRLDEDDKNLPIEGHFVLPGSAAVLPVLTNDVSPQAAQRSDEKVGMIAHFKADYRSIRDAIKGLTFRQVMQKLVEKWLWKWYAIVAVAIVLTVLISTYHEAIVHFCHPISKTIRGWPGGWLIPTALLVILSFPPLVGHEIVGILCGLVWGIGPGFAILAAGTFLGEIVLWVAFKWCCQTRAKKFEKENKLYASLAQLIREKSFTFILVLRFSAIPGHITTAVSASAGANFWSYLAAAFLTLPKQFSITYIGAAFGTKSTKNTIISTCMLVITILGTAVAAVYIYYQMRVVMRRREMTLPTTADDVTAGAGPTWQDLQNETSATTSFSRRGSALTGIQMSELARHPSHTNTLGVDTEGEKDPNMTGGIGGATGNSAVAAMHSRRPWLFTSNSYSSSSSKAPLRGWSVPGHMNEDELRSWRKEMESGINTPIIQVNDAAPPQFNPSFSPETPTRQFGASTASLVSISTDVDPRTPVIGSADDAGGRSPPSPISPYAPRRSLDSDRSSTPRTGRGGREIADEADQFAINHGARRPDMNRLRGESRAALLGRPDSSYRNEADNGSGLKRTGEE